MTTDRTTALRRVVPRHPAHRGLWVEHAVGDHAIEFPCDLCDALDRLERAEAAVGSPAFRAALDKVFTEPGEDFGPARGYYRPYLDEFVAALLAALDSAEKVR